NGQDSERTGTLVAQRQSCDIFSGSWVYDQSYPLCNSAASPFIDKEFDCLKNGRPDRHYLQYRWKPNDCELPRFNGLDFLERFRGKRIMFVGDSITLNQWQSFTCMLHTAVAEAEYRLTSEGDISTFTIPEYDVSVMFQRNVFLVDIVKEDIGDVLKLDSIEGSRAWEGIDMLIFNTWHWWQHTGSRQPWTYIQDGNQLYKDMDPLVAFEKGLTTWGNWVDSKVDTEKTKVVYVGTSPEHSNGKAWNEPKANCYQKKEPLNVSKYPEGPHPTEMIVQRVLQKMSKPITYLDITALSQQRVDGHPSIYGSYGSNAPGDCSHWCVAGVPDTWNELLYATLS
ncbi:hypothetical protein AQUCO_00400161v1, partial [Aquilegia coerulea]